jgi:hypothetical protein
MILLQPHPQELIQACRRQNGTAHSRAELAEALERRSREGPRTYTQAMADLEERLGEHEDGPAGRRLGPTTDPKEPS